MSILDSELCQQCGMPRYLCDSEDNDLQFRAVHETCAAKRVVDEQRDRDEKNNVNSNGTVIRPEPYSIEGRELISFREPYYKALAKKRENVAKAEALNSGLNVP